jgi:hypothetical protein
MTGDWGRRIDVVWEEARIDSLDFPMLECRIVAGRDGQCDNSSAGRDVGDSVLEMGQEEADRIDLHRDTPSCPLVSTVGRSTLATC